MSSARLRLLRRAHAGGLAALLLASGAACSGDDGASTTEGTTAGASTDAGTSGTSDPLTTTDDSSTSEGTSASSSTEATTSTTAGTESTTTGTDDSVCGDGVVEASEGCDDGNALSDDGCDADCQPSAVREVHVGSFHTCVLTRAGGVRCWGGATNGELGLGSTDNIGDDELPSSAPNVDLGGAATQLAVGYQHSCALLDSNELRCWGTNTFGQLGYGHTDTIGDDETPASQPPVQLGAGAIAQIALGRFHTCALFDDGRVRCWGVGTTMVNPSAGPLGYGIPDAIGDDEPPESAGDVPVGASVSAIALGMNHSCALTDAGDLRCWGDGRDGQLGYGDALSSGINNTPADTGDMPVGMPVDAVEPGSGTTCILVADGTLRCIGYNGNGALGLGNTEDLGDDELASDAPAIALDGDVLQVSAGSMTCVLLTGGDVRCWGRGEYGGPGQGSEDNLGDDELPLDVPVIDIGGPAVQISTKFVHTCALLEGGAVRCWGGGFAGQLGYGNGDAIGDDELVSELPDVEVFPR